MKITAKDSCNIICNLLQQHGIKHAVVSPGSRNAPLIVALARSSELTKTVVIDERSAAFIALGIASASDKPVALVCTSGTALLNYAPAIAEAYYRKIPLIVISADRPVEWIDQDDSQTLRQYEALSNYVKQSYNIPARCDNDTMKWYVNRIVNDAIITSNTGRRAPIHINVQIDEPLNDLVELKNSVLHEREIELILPSKKLPCEIVKELSRNLADKKILIIVGFNQPDNELNQALENLAQCANIVVMTESISNLKSTRFISSIDRTLSVMDEQSRKDLTPDIVMTLGGALVSRHIKQYMRSTKPKEHWHIGITDSTIDCFTVLTKRIETDASSFFLQISGELDYDVSSEYASKWHEIASIAEVSHKRYVSNSAWSDLTALGVVFDTIPSEWNVHLSNGSVVRYAQLFDTTRFNRIDCNRGVSGIDGSTSTAIGASVVNDDTTLLITGDMSAQYDIGALAAGCISSSFKMIVLNNGGGGIFRFVKSTSDLPELEAYFVAETKLPLKQIAPGYGFEYVCASSQTELLLAIDFICKENSSPVILEIKTPGEVSAQILKEYFNRTLI